MLRIAADSSSPGRSQVTLGLAPGTGSSGAMITVSPMMDDCATGDPIVKARLSSGGTLGVTLTAERGAGAAAYVARARIGRRSYSVELLVPPLREPIEEP